MGKNNIDRVKELARRHYATNKRRSAIWRAKNAKRHISYNVQWNKTHPESTRFFCAKRRSDKLMATPSWLTKIQLKTMKDIYAEASRLSRMSSVPYDVDHIVPLNGKNISGLRVPWNLQLLTRFDNIKKGNKFCEK